jgi:hypothetical protein
MKTGLELMREPFPANHILKRPQSTSNQTEELKRDRSVGIKCVVCGVWHHKNAVHLDYVGHAALTDRLLDCDPHWTWEPLAFDDKGLPLFDASGGLWIKLTVCGIQRLGYGHAQASNFKEIGSREKEVIGDALRNAAMRFGAALDLWHKGDLHADDEKTKPYYPDDRFLKNSPAWRNSIASGKRTKQQILDHLLKEWTVTGSQTEEIESWN